MGEGVAAGVDAVIGVTEFVQEPGIRSAGSALASIGGVVMMAPPPVGPVLGGALALVGGLMTIFGPEVPPPPSEEVIMIQRVNERLDSVLSN